VEISGSTEWTIITTDTVAQVGDSFIVDTSGGEIRVTLPLNPEINDVVRVADFAGLSTIDPIIIERNGERIMGLEEDFILDVANASIELNYISPVYGWKIVDGIGEAGEGAVRQSLIETWVFVDSAFTPNVGATAGVGHIIDTTTAPATVILPASPVVGDILAVAPGEPTWDVNPITIQGNGHLIQNQPADVVVDTLGIAYDLVYVGASYGWFIVEHQSDVVVNSAPIVNTVDDGAGSTFVLPLQPFGSVYNFRITNNPGATSNLEIAIGSIRATELRICHVGQGTLNVVAGAGVTINSKNSNLTLDGFGSLATLIKVSETEYDLYGDLV
jgi:hypothetical protein